MIDLKVKIGDVEFQNPLFTASGTFGYGSEINSVYDINILGGIISKTITQKPRKGNPPPRLCETASGMLNSIGLANVGIDGFIKEKLPFLQSLTTNLIVNIAGETPEDFIDLIRRLEEYEGISGYELNLSCPNVSHGLDFGTEPKVTEQVVSQVRKETKRLVIPKLTPNITNIALVAKAAEEGGADAVSLINTLLGMAISVKTRKPLLGNIVGGLSGPAIKPVALAKIWQARKAVTIPIIGVGGICTANDVLEFLICGATAVQLGTVNFFDPKAPITILDGLNNYLESQNFSSVHEVIGTLNA